MDFLPSVDLLRTHLVQHDMAIRQIMVLDAYIARLSGDTYVTAMDDRLSSGFQNMIRVSVAEGLKRMYKEYRLSKWLQVQEMAATVRRVLESGASLEETPPQPHEPPHLLPDVDGVDTWISPHVQFASEQRIGAETVLADMSVLSSIDADNDTSLNGFEPDVSTGDPYGETDVGYYGVNVPGASSDDALQLCDLSAILPHDSNVPSRIVVSHSNPILGAELYEQSVLNTATMNIDVSDSMIQPTREHHRTSGNVNEPSRTTITVQPVQPVQHHTHSDSHIVNNGQLNTDDAYRNDTISEPAFIIQPSQDNTTVTTAPDTQHNDNVSESVLNSIAVPPTQDNTVTTAATTHHSDNVGDQSMDSYMDWDEDSSYDDSLPGMLYAAQQLQPEDEAIRLDVEMGDMGIGHVLFDRVSRTWAVSHCEFCRDD